jgi:replicative DNA helicase
VVLAAGTGVGKSSFARAFAWGAIKSGLGDVLLANLEDGNDSLADRVLGEKTGFGASRLRKLDFQNSDHARIGLVSREPLLDQLFVSENLYDAKEFAAAVVAHREERPISLVVVDYLQLMRFKGINDNTARITAAMQTLAGLAKYIGAPVLALSQLTQKKVTDRGVEQFYKAKQAGVTGDELYEGFAPMMGDGHWASEIDQFAKMMIGVHRAGPYKRQMENKPDKDDRVEMRLLKSNHTACNRYTLGWNGMLTMAYDLAT